MQLVLSIDNVAAAEATTFKWYWLGHDMNQLLSEGLGSLDDLMENLREQAQAARTQAWLLLPGNKVSARQLHYAESEKKHLQKILPYQLEDALIDDIEDLHFAFSAPKDGSVTLSYIDKAWLQELFAALNQAGVDVARCVAAPALLPQAAPVPAVAVNEDEAILQESEVADPVVCWSLALFAGELWVKPSAQDAFSVPLNNAPIALQLALATQAQNKRIEVALFADTDAGLNQLQQLLQAHPDVKIIERNLQPAWQLDYRADAVNLCQGDFALRLPLDRWWKLWQPSVVLLAIGFVIYLASTLISLSHLKEEARNINRELEREARKVIPEGRLVNITRQVEALLPNQPTSNAAGTARVVNTLGAILPAVAQVDGVEIKALVYVSETGETIVNLQANNFAVFDELANKVREQGYQAEISSANAQGDVQTARLTVKQ